jgi:hypothetical protein
MIQTVYDHSEAPPVAAQGNAVRSKRWSHFFC